MILRTIRAARERRRADALALAVYRDTIQEYLRWFASHPDLCAVLENLQTASGDVPDRDFWDVIGLRNRVEEMRKKAMTDHYDQREDLHAAKEARRTEAMNTERRFPLPRDAYNVLCVLNHAGANRLKRADFAHCADVLPKLEYLGLIARGIDLDGEMLSITERGKSRMYAVIDLWAVGAPTFDAVLTPEAAARVRALPPLTGNLSDVLVPNPHSHGVDPNGGHSFALHTHTPSHSHGITDGGQTHGFSGPRDYMKPGATYVRGDQVYCAETHQSIGPTGNRGPVCDPGLPTHNPAPTAENGPLRVRLFADGAMVIDNPERPLAVYPVAHTGAHESDPVTMTLDSLLAKNLSLFVKTIAKE
jgi:hypothetical protein